MQEVKIYGTLTSFYRLIFGAQTVL